MVEGAPLSELKVKCLFILHYAGYPAGLPPEYAERKGCLSFTEKRPFCQFFPCILQGTNLLFHALLQLSSCSVPKISFNTRRGAVSAQSVLEKQVNQIGRSLRRWFFG
jgi:hypothetical protein